jgi:acetyltransferase-like isoleucine patch superfamily enzyme
MSRTLRQKALYSADRRRRYGPLPRLLSALRRWRAISSHPRGAVRIPPSAHLGPGFTLHIPGAGRFIAGEDAEFRADFRAEVEADGEIRIGDGTAFTYDVVLQCTRSIEIGCRCVVAHGVTIVDGQHRFGDPSRPIGEQGYEWHPVRIGDDCWLGASATVMADLGDRVVIGANSAVTEPIAAGSVAVGAPARVVSRIDGS